MLGPIDSLVDAEYTTYRMEGIRIIISVIFSKHNFTVTVYTVTIARAK